MTAVMKKIAFDSHTMADCFPVATSMELEAKVVTGDPDFKKTIRLVAVEWI